MKKVFAIGLPVVMLVILILGALASRRPIVHAANQSVTVGSRAVATPNVTADVEPVENEGDAPVTAEPANGQLASSIIGSLGASKQRLLDLLGTPKDTTPDFPAAKNPKDLYIWHSPKDATMAEIRILALVERKSRKVVEVGVKFQHYASKPLAGELWDYIVGNQKPTNAWHERISEWSSGGKTAMELITSHNGGRFYLKLSTFDNKIGFYEDGLEEGSNGEPDRVVKKLKSVPFDWRSESVEAIGASYEPPDMAYENINFRELYPVDLLN